MPAATQPRRLVYMPLDEILPADRNPKEHDEQGLDRSVDTFGYAEPVLLDERTGRLVAGHGRLDTLARRRARGEAAPDGVVVKRDGTWTVPVVRGWASDDDDHAAAYLVASNRLTERGGWRGLELLELLDEMAARDDGLLLASGYTDEEYRLLLTEHRLPEPTPPEEFPGVDDDLATQHECPRCGFQWSGASGPTS